MAGTHIARQSSDSQIVTAVRGGDVEAFALLVERYQTPLHRYLVTRADDPDIAADLTQDSFCDALCHLDRFAEDRSFAAWLFGIARHRLLMHWRTNRERRLVSLEGMPSRLAETVPTLCLPDRSERCVERDCVRRVLAELSPPLRVALLLHCRDGLSAPEVATFLGISRAAAEQRICRAKEQFRRCYLTVGRR